MVLMQLIGCFPQNYLPVALKLSLHQNHLKNLSGHGFLGPIPRVSDSVGLGWGQKICMPRILMRLVQRPQFENHCALVH